MSDVRSGFDELAKLYDNGGKQLRKAAEGMCAIGDEKLALTLRDWADVSESIAECLRSEQR